MQQPILTREQGEHVSSVEGTHVVPLDTESGNYREWTIGVLHQQYCIVQEGETWTLLVYDPAQQQWQDAPGEVETFLATHQLILAA
ncbi:MAG TPA: hypothetical protein VI542_06085 [Candidatus Tectomicrobia bacterium]